MTVTVNSAYDERVSTGVAGLDQMIGGGVLRGDASIVAGSPGCGKTTLGLHFIAAGVQEGEPGVFVTFEYLPQQIYRDAAKRGWPLQEWEEEGKVRLVCTTPEIMLAQIGQGETLLDEAIQEVRAKRLVLDSMTHFEALGLEGQELRSSVSGFMNHLRMLDVTSVLTHEIKQIIGPTVTISDYGLEFLVDNVIMLRYVELEGELQKALNVLKFRGGDHDRNYRSYQLTDKGVVIEASFEGVEGISSGSATRRFEHRARKLI